MNRGPPAWRVGVALAPMPQLWPKPVQVGMRDELGWKKRDRGGAKQGTLLQAKMSWPMTVPHAAAEAWVCSPIRHLTPGADPLAAADKGPGRPAQNKAVWWVRATLLRRLHLHHHPGPSLASARLLSARLPHGFFLAT